MTDSQMAEDSEQFEKKKKKKMVQRKISQR